MVPKDIHSIGVEGRGWEDLKKTIWDEIVRTRTQAADDYGSGGVEGSFGRKLIKVPS